MDLTAEHIRACTEMMSAMLQMPGGAAGMAMMGGIDLVAITWLTVLSAAVGVLALNAILLSRAIRRWPSADRAARAVADARYARGELAREEYLAPVSRNWRPEDMIDG